MRKLFFSFSFVILLTTPAKSEFAMLGFGKESCSEMVETTSTGSQMDQVYKFAYTAYILGFFTGVNAMENKATGLEEIDTLYKKDNNLSFESLLKLAMNHLDQDNSNLAR